MNVIEQPRQPVGAPRSSGGQFREAMRREASLDLSEDREQAIAAGGHVPATFTTERGPGTAGAWWDHHASVAEWAGEGAAFPKMPGDWTPQRAGGASDSGLRRTHRMTYEGNGFALRMPSAASVRSFAATNRGAFDLPVQATDAQGREITAWVRAVQHRPGSWSVSGLGFGGTTDAQVSEAVASVLESRRPSAALRTAGDLIERHRQRTADRGQQLHSLRSSWISAVGYDDIDKLMIMRTRSRTDARGMRRPDRTYGSMVERDVFEALRASDNPGTIFNRCVKGSPGQMVQTCGSCGRSCAASRTHTCPVEVETVQPPIGVDQSHGRASALRGIRRRRRGRQGAQPVPADPPEDEF